MNTVQRRPEPGAAAHGAGVPNANPGGTIGGEVPTSQSGDMTEINDSAEQTTSSETTPNTSSAASAKSAMAAASEEVPVKRAFRPFRRTNVRSAKFKASWCEVLVEARIQKM